MYGLGLLKANISSIPSKENEWYAQNTLDGKPGRNTANHQSITVVHLQSDTSARISSSSWLDAFRSYPATLA